MTSGETSTMFPEHTGEQQVSNWHEILTVIVLRICFGLSLVLFVLFCRKPLLMTYLSRVVTPFFGFFVFIFPVD